MNKLIKTLLIAIAVAVIFAILSFCLLFITAIKVGLSTGI